MKRLAILIILLCAFCASALAGGAVDCVKVAGKPPKNKEVEVWYRVPSSYDENSKALYRVVVFFGGRNFSGKPQVSYAHWGKWADENEIFLVSPTFIDDDYWEPQRWSGKALIDGLDKIKKQYRICDRALIFYGYSAGAQCSNLFPAWMPERTRAYVSHASGVLHKPNTAMKNIPALLTCGDVDRERYMLNRNFIEAYRRLGANVLWKSFPNRPHDVPEGSTYLAWNFMAYYHKKYSKDLDPAQANFKEPNKILFVGDDLDGAIFEADSPAAKNILPEDRVNFTSEEIAKAWEKSGTMR